MSEILPKHRIFDERSQEAAREDMGAPGTATTSKSRSAASAVAGADFADEKTTLLPTNECKEMRSRWDRIQVEFIDQPRKSVEQANALVADAMARLTAVFTQERQNMEQQWDRKENVSTEDLRQALRRYRSFFARLLTV